MLVLVHKFDYHIMLYLVEFDFVIQQQFVHFPMFSAIENEEKKKHTLKFFLNKLILTAGIYRIIKL
jgi:hypothetical protein